jgi:hypothetical protein
MCLLLIVGFRLENTPDVPPISGTIYVDDLQSGALDVTAVRFLRTDGRVVDAIWSANPTTVELLTDGEDAEVIDRYGNSRRVVAKAGVLFLSASESPIYVVHTKLNPAAVMYPR